MKVSKFTDAQEAFNIKQAEDETLVMVAWDQLSDVLQMEEEVRPAHAVR
jgi:hypothetical protein